MLIKILFNALSTFFIIFFQLLFLSIIHFLFVFLINKHKTTIFLAFSCYPNRNPTILLLHTVFFNNSFSINLTCKNFINKIIQITGEFFRHTNKNS